MVRAVRAGVTGATVSVMTSTPSGTLIRLETPDVAATIAPVGAALRGLVIDGVEVVPDYPHDVPAPACSGVVLVPWPNRIRDGKWAGGQLAITEPDRNNAIHGLLRYTEYAVTESDAASVTLAADVYPQLGYPFWLHTSVQYRIHANGIIVTHTIENAGTTPAPFGVGAHPFLTIQDPSRAIGASDIQVRIPAREYYVVDERLLPTGVARVAGTAAALHEYRPLSELALDTGYRVEPSGTPPRFESVLKVDGVGTAGLWQDANFGYVQVYTRQEYPSTHGPVPAIAIEPQTCATDAFNTGDGLQYLEAGEAFVASWGITFAR